MQSGLWWGIFVMRTLSTGEMLPNVENREPANRLQFVNKRIKLIDFVLIEESFLRADKNNTKMGKGFNNYMTKKFFHPGSKENIKRVCIKSKNLFVGNSDE